MEEGGFDEDNLNSKRYNTMQDQMNTTLIKQKFITLNK
jgi:hypothetical protein